jgi:hypothetical protein
VSFPARQRAPFEVAEAELVLELLVLLFDRPARIRPGGPGRAASPRAGERTDSTSCLACRRDRVGRASTSRAPADGRLIVRRRHAHRAEGRALRCVRPVAPRHRCHALDDWAALQARASRVVVSAARLGLVRCRPRPAGAGGACNCGVPRRSLRSHETPSAYRSRARCSVRRSVALSPNSASPTTAVAVIRAARTSRRQRKGQLPLVDHGCRGRDPRPRALGRVSHASGR